MAKTRETYRVVSGDMVDQLNFIFARIADRLDKLEGIRGTPKIEGDTVELGSELQTRIKGLSVYTEAPDGTLNDGEFDIQVYDSGSPVLRVRYRDGDDIRVGDLSLT